MFGAKGKSKARWSERQLAILGLAAGVIGIGGVLLTVYSLLVDAKSIAEILLVALGFIAIFSVSSFVVFYLLMREIVASHDEFQEKTSKFIEMEEARDLALAERDGLQKNKAEFESATKRIAILFNDMSSAVNDYETAVSGFRRAANRVETSIQAREVLDQHWEQVANLWHTALVSICDAAAHTIAIKKGQENRNVCFSNIKLVSSKDEDEYYKVLFYSSKTGKERREAEKTPRLVKRNRIYQDMIERQDVVLVEDMDKYVDGLYPYRLSYDLPSKSDNARFYKSCLVAAVYSKGSSELTVRQLIGIFCVDSTDYSFFNDDYDRLIVTQVVNHAASCLLSYVEAGAIQMALSRNASDAIGIRS